MFSFWAREQKQIIKINVINHLWWYITCRCIAFYHIQLWHKGRTSKLYSAHALFYIGFKCVKTLWISSSCFQRKQNSFPFHKYSLIFPNHILQKFMTRNSLLHQKCKQLDWTELMYAFRKIRWSYFISGLMK